MAHFLVGCGEVKGDRLVLLDDVCRIVVCKECGWIHFGEWTEGKVAFCCWEKGWRAYVTE